MQPALFERPAGDIVHCPRCGLPCRLHPPENEDARLLKKTADISNGLCPNCAVTSWFMASPLWEMVRDKPEALLLPHFQAQFAELMQAGNADMKPGEINWQEVVRNWNLPMPRGRKAGKGRQSRR